MLKKRIIPVMLLRGNRLVKTVKFDSIRDVGDPVDSAKVYNAQDADELLFLNIKRCDVGKLEPVITAVARECFMPITIGGGIRCLEDAEWLFHHGADKVVVNSNAYSDPGLITGIANDFGSQAVVVCIDVRWQIGTLNDYTLLSYCTDMDEDSSLEEHISAVIDAGAGEIMIQSKDRDGTMLGYDMRLLERVMECSTVPVIAAGGAGNYGHLKEAFLEADVSACACGSLFNFTDSSPLRAKSYLANYGIPIKVV